MNEHDIDGGKHYTGSTAEYLGSKKLGRDGCYLNMVIKERELQWGIIWASFFLKNKNEVGMIECGDIAFHNISCTLKYLFGVRKHNSH